MRLFIIINLFTFLFSQTCQDNCGSGTLQDYFDGIADCVCSLDCAGYGDACCDFYDVCYENPSNFSLSSFVGSWHGNITNDQTFSYDDPISIIIESDGSYSVPNNPGGHLISDLYPGTEKVYYGTNFYGINVLQFEWVSYYHYACGGPCYTGAAFQVMEYGDGEMTLFYNNGSGPAPQANSLFLSMDDECMDGEINNDNPCMPMECYDGQWVESVIDCEEQMGVPCINGIYLDPEEGECCSVCVLLGDLNSDSNVNVLDAIEAVNLVLYGEYNEIADMNFDGVVNILDIIEIIYIILN
tara:strand:- start:13 stop:906 length:894 start_codon:yes stop_codon:yes gene_type:complete